MTSRTLPRYLTSHDLTTNHITSSHLATNHINTASQWLVTLCTFYRQTLPSNLQSKPLKLGIWKQTCFFGKTLCFFQVSVFAFQTSLPDVMKVASKHHCDARSCLSWLLFCHGQVQKDEPGTMTRYHEAGVGSFEPIH